MEPEILVSSHDPNGLLNLAKLTKGELIEIMVQRVIYETDTLIAFDKPYNIPYSGSKSTRLQIDRILQELKKRLCPTSLRFHLVESLDRCASGVLLFAKTDDQLQTLRKDLAGGHFEHRFRCLVRGIPEEEAATIAIPLYKQMKSNDMKLLPAIKRTPGKVYHVNTKYQVVNQNRSASISLVDVTVPTSSVHQIRSHLAFGVNCPLVGEFKYNPKEMDKHVVLSRRALEPLGYEPRDFRKIPMFLHLAETVIPLHDKTRFSVIKAPMPPYFLNALKCLSLSRK